MEENMKILDATGPVYEVKSADTGETIQKTPKFYTVYSYRLARTLLKHGCVIADIGINRRMKGIVFHFVNEPKLAKIVKLQKTITQTQREINEISGKVSASPIKSAVAPSLINEDKAEEAKAEVND